MDNILEIAKQLANLYETMYELAASQVSYIMNNHITSSDVIEHCLDQILDIPTNKGWELLQIMCSYYWPFNQKVSQEYLDIYCELYDIKTKTKKRT